MMKRSTFVAGVAAAVASGAARPARAAQTTLDDLVRHIPDVRSHTWVQYVMGSDVRYLKMIGYGSERSTMGVLPYIETQIGDNDISCNPNTIRKSFLPQAAYGGLMQPHAVKMYVVKAGTSFILEDSNLEKLWLLDADNLYTQRAATVMDVRHDAVRVHARTFLTRRYELAFSSHHGDTSLQTMTLWLSPQVPLGVVKMRATVAGLDPFDLRIDTFGHDYVSLVTEPIDAMRHKA